MLAYVDAIIRENSITIDGYTSAKTEKGIIRDVARAVAKYNKEEAECLIKTAKEYNPDYNNPFVPQCYDSESYFFIYEEVPCASCWNEEKEEMKYRDGFHNYFCIRIIR